MPKFGKTVVLITVFLMLIFGGCYTKLKHPRPVIYPDGASASQNGAAWDFSYGWHGPCLEMYPEAYSYYYLQWWDDCCWHNDNYCIKPDNNDESIGGKIVRRDDIYIPHRPMQFDFPDRYNQGQNNIAPPPGKQHNQPQPIQPKAIDKNNSKTKTTKIAHRGRR